MNLYEAIEEELTKALEQGATLPKVFTLRFAESEFLALLNSVIDKQGQRFPVTTTLINLSMCGHVISVVRDL